jgi:hypothetical protein
VSRRVRDPDRGSQARELHRREPTGAGIEEYCADARASSDAKGLGIKRFVGVLGVYDRRILADLTLE